MFLNPSPKEDCGCEVGFSEMVVVGLGAGREGEGGVLVAVLPPRRLFISARGSTWRCMGVDVNVRRHDVHMLEGLGRALSNGFIVYGLQWQWQWLCVVVDDAGVEDAADIPKRNLNFLICQALLLQPPCQCIRD